MTPSHIAFIMDGNGRWAERRHLPRKYGHKMGTEALERTVEAAAECGIKTVTFYAFSTENWSRPQSEIDYLMDTFRKFLARKNDYQEKNYRLVFIGNLGKLPQDIADSCRDAMARTESNTGLTVVIAMNYGSWEEITSAVNQLLAQGKTQVTEQDIVRALYTSTVSFPDLVVRTGGEIRLSNFLLLQSAYSELLFTDTLWPDFDKKELKKVIEIYSKRVRKFGGLGGDHVEA
ncbi:MAG TPA: di-trans,poly-cis-decaprenylcistransferase [Clostridiales bacterium]|nr:di-trans,poly-cis-decaprenylcistransferase [Clostridiales bacterium]HCU55797.1 di-trans,poly-cis-decaprenylcistransferase [Clostridiales bacterium]